MQRILVRLGNNIVDTKLPGDDDDLKPPADWKYKSDPIVATSETPSEMLPNTENLPKVDADKASAQVIEPADEVTEALHGNNAVPCSDGSQSQEHMRTSTPRELSSPAMSGSWVSVDRSGDDEDDYLLSGVHRQAWSFANL